MTAALAEPGDPPARWDLRMRDLCERSGLPRQAIHFYIQQGLLPPGRKTGRNMAFYGESHVERLLLVKKLQHERFLPLRAIKALLDDRDTHQFSPKQRAFLREVRAHLAPSELTRARAGGESSEPAPALAARTGAALRDVERLVEAGLVGARRDDDGTLRVAADDVWIVEVVAQLRAAGFGESLGFEVDDLAVYDEAVGTILRFEAELLSRRLAGLSPEKAAAMMDRALPLMQAFVARMHAERLRDFLETL